MEEDISHNLIIIYNYYFLLMRDETPNERNYRLLKERFLYDDRIVYDDGKAQFTLEMLKEKHLIIDRRIGYHSDRYLTGNEAIIYLLKSPSNRIRNEITHIITNLELEWLQELKCCQFKWIEDFNGLYLIKNNNHIRLFENEIVNPIHNQDGEVVGFEIEREDGSPCGFMNTRYFEIENEPANEKEPQFTIEIDYGNEQPLEMKFIDENGNEKVRKIEKIIGNGIEKRIIFANENENGNEEHCGNGNGNGNENGMINKLRTIKEHIKKIL